MTKLLIASLVFAQAQAAPDAGRQPDGTEALHTLDIDRTTAAIQVDGDLGDPGWAAATRTTSFTEFMPEQGAEPPAKTEALLTYDEEHLYVAFIAHADPSKIRATLRDRDKVFGDDMIGVVIDTYGDASWAYFLMVNPHGVQTDARFTSQGEDPNFDIIFESDARITDSGYIVEMAIPFTSLRFPDSPEQSWRINLYRDMPRASRHQIAWAPLSRDNPCILCQSGRLTGIRGVRAGGTLEILPSVVAHRTGTLADGGDPSSAFQSADVEGEASLGLRYAFAGGWTAEATYNPDFSQVEADAAQIDVNTTFALDYPEKRPFFQEGSDLYDTSIRQVYTRSINAPVFAGKLTGRFGQTNVAYVGARDEHSPYVLPFEERSAVLEGGESVSNVFRGRRNLYEDSYVGALVTDRRMDGGGSGTTAGADALFRFAKNYVINAQIVSSYTREPDDAALTEGLEDLDFGYGDDVHTAAFDGESYWGRASHLQVARRAEFWSVSLSYRDATPTFRADNGFQTRNDFRRVSAWTGLDFYPDVSVIDQIAPSISAGSGWNFDGVRKERWIEPRFYMMLVGQTRVSAGLEAGDERFRGVDFDGMRRVSFNVNSSFSNPVSLGFYISRGETIARNTETPTLGTGTNASVWAEINPIPRIVVQPRFSYAELEDPETGDEVYAGYILRSRLDVQFTRRLFLRFVTQYNDFGGAWDVDPLLTYKVNPYSVFYVGSTHDFGDFGEPAGLTETDRQIFLKFQYLFRR